MENLAKAVILNCADKLSEISEQGSPHGNSIYTLPINNPTVCIIVTNSCIDHIHLTH